MLVIQSTQLKIENCHLLKEQKLPYFAMEQVIHFCFDSKKHVGLHVKVCILSRYHESLFTKIDLIIVFHYFSKENLKSIFFVWQSKNESPLQIKDKTESSPPPWVLIWIKIAQVLIWNAEMLDFITKTKKSLIWTKPLVFESWSLRL